MDVESINFSDLCNAEIVARMRKCNYEQFKTLVRMHLSFELDLNTDEFDLPCHEILYEDKGKLKKWNRLSKKYKLTSSTCTNKTCTSSNSIDSNSPNNGLQDHIDAGFLFHLQELKEFLMLEKNLLQEGIFRKTGSVSRQNELRLQIQNDKPLNLDLGDYSAHDCSTVFKSYLAELPEPLLTDAHYPAHLQIAPLCLSVNPNMNDAQQATAASKSHHEKQKRDIHVLTSVQLLLLLLPDENRQLLQHIIEILHAVALQQASNKMSADNLATLFTPHLICPRNLPPEALHYVSKKMSSIISYMIVRGLEIFAVPAKLATDIRAFFMERKRKKTMSPDMALDESISDISTVNTVYTFVDRERTAAAHNTNNTDTELAQLYAFIQSLPESSKKRRLIKQFNKQNGQGTPLQLQAMNRVKNSELNKGTKSLSDSIKKHIFQKGLMSRTPKRPVASTVISLETPNTAGDKKHKQRVLFQSPHQPIHTYATTHSTPSLASPSYSNLSTTKCINSNTFNIKSHPLQKSISSTSLLISSNVERINVEVQEDSSCTLSSANSCSSSVSTSNRSIINTNNDNAKSKTETKSAPVSRQSSSDLQQRRMQETTISTKTAVDTRDAMNFISHLKLLSHATKHLMTGVDFPKKPVLNIHQQIRNFKHPLQSYTSGHELKTRYKSEPNLSICDSLPNNNSTSIQDTVPPISKLMQSKCISKKKGIMKGVSMGNLKFAFNTPESTKRLVRTVSSNVKHRFSDDTQLQNCATVTFAADLKTSNIPLLKDMDDNDLDDDTFEDDPADDCGDSGSASYLDNDSPYMNPSADNATRFTLNVDMASYQQLPLRQCGVYRNRNLLTSTPSSLADRRSMSPITISTQRMPKAMQESIMTPRSRKPVMVLTTTTSSTEQNQTIVAADLSDFPDSKAQQSEDNKNHCKDSYIVNKVDDGGNTCNLLPQDLPSQRDSYVPSDTLENQFPETLSIHFKEYLLKRSVLTERQGDASTSSHSDDYDSSPKFENINDNQLSKSLLFCLDGNSPADPIPLNNTSQAESDTVKENSNNSSQLNRALPMSEAPTHAECSDCIAISDDKCFSIKTSTSSLTTATTSKTNRLANNPFVIFNKVRKRAASSDLDKIASKLFNSQIDYINHINEHINKEDAAIYLVDTLSEEKENRQQNNDFVLADKLLINEYPDETLF